MVGISPCCSPTDLGSTITREEKRSGSVWICWIASPDRAIQWPSLRGLHTTAGRPAWTFAQAQWKPRFSISGGR
ncbi:MAG: hypothetical protein IH997_03715 [Proteobacteria bacterium]|nr:hypothetical protein [Pseudomonadota bacterium]